MIEMLGMCGIRQPSCLSLVASLTGKCLLVLPLSPGSLGWPACVLLHSCVCPFGEMSRGVSRSPASPVATARIHSLMADKFVVGSCMPVPVS